MNELSTINTIDVGETNAWNKPKLMPLVKAQGKMTLCWEKKTDTAALGGCVCCTKAIKKGQIYTELNLVKKNPYRTEILEFNFFLHKKCLIMFLQDCPYESVEVLQGIDLTELDNF